MKRKTIIILAIFYSILVRAQVFSDAQIWQKSDLEFSFSKFYSFGLQDEIRFTNNSQSLSYYYIDVGNVFKLNKNLRLALDYVFVGKEKKDLVWSFRHQYNISMSYRFKMRRFLFYNRVLNEGQFVDINTSANGHFIQDEFIRDKITMRYRLRRKLTPYIEDEIYYRLIGDAYKNPRGFNRNRTYVGMLYDINKTVRLDAFFLYENNFFEAPHSQNFIYCIGFSKSLF